MSKAEPDTRIFRWRAFDEAAPECAPQRGQIETDAARLAIEGPFVRNVTAAEFTELGLPRRAVAIVSYELGGVCVGYDFAMRPPGLGRMMPAQRLKAAQRARQLGWRTVTRCDCASGAMLPIGRGGRA